VEFIGAALKHTYRLCQIDRQRMALAGHSDGASYSLSLGLGTGDTFGHVIAFSPGVMKPAEVHGKPHIFISHGLSDPIMPIDVTSRRFVPRLKNLGYDVTYREYEGRHGVTQADRPGSLRVVPAVAPSLVVRDPPCWRPAAARDRRPRRRTSSCGIRWDRGRARATSRPNRSPATPAGFPGSVDDEKRNRAGRRHAEGDLPQRRQRTRDHRSRRRRTAPTATTAIVAAERPRWYYLSIDSADVDWTVSVDERIDAQRVSK
jgi:hypothetical protein